MRSVVTTAEVYSSRRILDLSKGNSRIKVNARELQQEMINASVFGELSALERIMADLIDDPNLTREEIEAKLHLSIVDLYNVIRSRFKMGPSQVTLENYLSLRGYYNKDSLGRKTIEQ